MDKIFIALFALLISSCLFAKTQKENELGEQLYELVQTLVEDEEEEERKKKISGLALEKQRIEYRKGLQS